MRTKKKAKATPKKGKSFVDRWTKVIKRTKRPLKAKKVVGKRVRRKIPKSLDEIIVWRPHFEEGRHDDPNVKPYWHESFEPAVVPLRLLPRDIREHYTFKEIDLESAMCYPGKRRQIYGRAIKPHIYFVIQRKDGLKDAWAKLPSPSLRDMGPYWQKDLSIKFYKPWPW